MRFLRRFLSAGILLFCCLAAAQTARRKSIVPAQTGRPRLVVLIVIDQFRADYLDRFRDGYSKGLRSLLTDGAVFSEAFYDHYPNVTAVGHSTLLSGATPAISGIIENEWFDRTAGKNVTSVSDASVKALGGTGPGASPHRMLTSTLCDQLKMAEAEAKTRCFGVSLKDRSAILPNGRMADAAYWFDDGQWLTSTYYMSGVPGWVADINASHPGERYKGQPWRALGAPTDAKPFKTLPKEVNPAYWTALDASPWGNELILEFALRAIEAEHVGQKAGETDVLSVSFSSNDLYGHEMGPDDPGVRDLALRVDEQIGRLLQSIDRKVGLANTVVVLSADHGVAPTEEAQRERHMAGGRLSANVISKAINDALAVRYGAGNWVLSAGGGLFPYLDHARIAAAKLSLAEVRQAAADAIRALPAEAHVARVYTPEQIMTMGSADMIDRRVRNGFHPTRGSDLYVVYEPFYYVRSGKGANHQSPYNYDAHVPLIFLGPGIKKGVYDETVVINDVAPTLARMLRVEPPAGSVGRVLTEMMAKQ
jgi:predicted AlkP superfamily pyrophosphatase or phosphodiesterase